MSTFTNEDVPCLARRTRLRYDSARNADVLLYPEGVLVLNGSAAAILKLCDGVKTAGEIARDLSHQAQLDVTNDVIKLLDRLLVRGLVEMRAATL